MNYKCTDCNSDRVFQKYQTYKSMNDSYTESSVALEEYRCYDCGSRTKPRKVQTAKLIYQISPIISSGLHMLYRVGDEYLHTCTYYSSLEFKTVVYNCTSEGQIIDPSERRQVSTVDPNKALEELGYEVEV